MFNRLEVVIVEKRQMSDNDQGKLVEVNWRGCVLLRRRSFSDSIFTSFQAEWRSAGHKGETTSKTSKLLNLKSQEAHMISTFHLGNF